MITIVSGLPRSGTSLMMQMLDCGGMPVLTDNVRNADENNRRGYFEYEKVKGLQSDNKWVEEAEGKAVKIIAQLLPYVPRTFQYSVIYVIRPIEQVIASQQKMLNNLEQQGAKLTIEQLTNVYSAQTRRAQNWLMVSKIKTLFVFYPEVLSSPAEKAREIQSFLGLDLDVEKMASVVDSSLWHQGKNEINIQEK